MIWTIAAGVVIGGLALGAVGAGLRSMSVGEATRNSDDVTVGALVALVGLVACVFIVVRGFHFI